MPLLPPLPPDVLELQLTIECGGTDTTIVQHFLCSGSIAWGYSEFSEFNSGWSSFAETWLLQCMPSDSSFTTFRLSRYGSLPFRYVNMVAGNAGALGGAQSLNSAMCLTWHTEIAGSVSRSHNRVPLAGSAVDSGKQLIDQGTWSSIQLSMSQYIATVNAITISGFSNPEFIIVSRKSGGRARPAAVFAPVISGAPSRHVATLASRTRKAR